MSFTVGVVAFDGAEELDFVGPWEVFAMAAKVSGEGRVVLLAEEAREVRGAKGLRVVPEIALADAPPLDVLVVPGGEGVARQIERPAVLAALARIATTTTWVTSVCTGSLLLHAAGVAKGKRVTTHWSAIARLRARGDVTVLEGVRYVRDGNLVTSAGVSAGIDMSLWVVGQLRSIDLARQVQRQMEYDPAPPYGADV